MSAYWPSKPPPVLVEVPHLFRFELYHLFCLESPTDGKGLFS